MMKLFLLMMIIVVPAEHPKDYIKHVENIKYFTTKEKCMESAKRSSENFGEYINKHDKDFPGFASFGCMPIEIPRSY